MHKKFEINRTKIKGGYQSGRKVLTHNSKGDLRLVSKHFPSFLITHTSCRWMTVVVVVLTSSFRSFVRTP